MKQSAPLDWQHSNSDGVRVRRRGRSGMVTVEAGLWAGGGGLSGAVVPDNQETKPLLPRQNLESQKLCSQSSLTHSQAVDLTLEQTSVYSSDSVGED